MDAQLGFAGLLKQADTDNRRRELDRATVGLPGEMEAAIRYHRQQIKTLHAAIQALDFSTSEEIRERAHLMAVKVNNGEPGILAGRDAPGCVIERRCAAASGKVPLFGQAGRFRIDVYGCTVLVEMDGMFGIGGQNGLPGFSANAVNLDKPFVSETGYRSFLSSWGFKIEPNMTTADYASKAIAAHVAREMKGKLVPIAQPSRKFRAAHPPKNRGG